MSCTKNDLYKIYQLKQGLAAQKKYVASGAHSSTPITDLRRILRNPASTRSELENAKATVWNLKDISEAQDVVDRIKESGKTQALNNIRAALDAREQAKRIELANQALNIGQSDIDADIAWAKQVSNDPYSTLADIAQAEDAVYEAYKMSKGQDALTGKKDYTSPHTQEYFDLWYKLREKRTLTAI